MKLKSIKKQKSSKSNKYLSYIKAKYPHSYYRVVPQIKKYEKASGTKKSKYYQEIYNIYRREKYLELREAGLETKEATRLRTLSIPKNYKNAYIEATGESEIEFYKRLISQQEEWEEAGDEDASKHYHLKIK